jgi:hypothetical protein
MNDFLGRPQNDRRDCFSNLSYPHWREVMKFENAEQPGVRPVVTRGNEACCAEHECYVRNTARTAEHQDPIAVPGTEAKPWCRGPPFRVLFLVREEEDLKKVGPSVLLNP